MFTVKDSNIFNSGTVSAAIKYVNDLASNFNRLDKYYRGIHDILGRDKKSDELANNRLVINHAKFITDINVGFMVGNSIRYQSSSKDFTKIEESFESQEIEFEDNALAEDVSIYGIGFEVSFIDETKNIITKVVDPAHCVVIYDDTFKHDPVGAVIFTDPVEGVYSNIRVYSGTEIQLYSGKIDDLKSVSNKPKKHGFSRVPVVEYSNNRKQLGDFEVVLELINAYNTLQSDRVNDKQQLVESLLLFYGFKMEAAQLKAAKRDRVVSDIPKDGKAEFLVKQIDEVSADVLRKALENDIHKISMTPNLSDENFVGNSSGVALLYKLLPFFKNISKKERFFRKGLMQRLKLYSDYLKVLGKGTVDISDVEIQFVHSMPKNDFETSQMIVNLQGVVDIETLIGQLSFIDDPKAAIERVKAEQTEGLQVPGILFGKNKTNAGEDITDEENNE